MTDSKDNTRYPQSKILSNSLRLKSPKNITSRQNVSNILNRLSYLRTLSQAQNQLLLVTPVWQQWCANQTGSVITDYASPASLDGKTLTISCKQSSTATILKHTQSSLLEALHKRGFDQIQSIRVQMSLNQSDHEQCINSTINSPKMPSQPTIAKRKPSAASLKSIETTQSLVKNQDLAAALKRLAETLKKAT
jgi:hypothetical protein